MLDRVGLRRPGRGDRDLDAPRGIPQEMFTVLPDDLHAMPEPGDAPRYADSQPALQVVNPLGLRHEPTQISEFDIPRLFLFAVVLGHKRKKLRRRHTWT